MEKRHNAIPNRWVSHIHPPHLFLKAFISIPFSILIFINLPSNGHTARAHVGPTPGPGQLAGASGAAAPIPPGPDSPVRRPHPGDVRRLQQRQELPLLRFQPLRQGLLLRKSDAGRRSPLRRRFLPLCHRQSLRSRREIYVVWRGTTRDLEWINVFGAAPESASGLLSTKSLKDLKHGNKHGDSSSSDEDEDPRTAKVMKGWLTIYTSNDPNSPFTKTSARTQVLTHVKALLQRYKSQSPSLVLVGHSLKEEYRIPGSWWVEKNKGMVRREDGEWVLDAPQQEDLPVPEQL
uniref:Phospholipase A1 n=1 Tax=Cajanus cajan TaxID=3821 RepID=A0A151TL46_CAJCA|nr:hypothetical protein KK1_024112 [Cajanus cajan]